MFNPTLWALVRPIYGKTFKESFGIGAGAGTGFFFAGASILPALAVAGVTVGAAVVLRGVWDKYKLANGKISEQDVVDKWRAIIQPESNRSGLSMAASYNDALDILTRYSAQGRVRIFHLNTMKSIDDSLESVLERLDSADTLQHLKEKSESLIRKHGESVAKMEFIEAIVKPVLQDIERMVNSIDSLRDAIDANQMMKNVHMYSDKQRVYEDRLVQLQEKFTLVKETAARGFLVEDYDSDVTPSTLRYIMDNIARVDQKLNPGVAVILRADRTISEKELDLSWSDVFQMDAAARKPGDMVVRMQQFQNDLSQHAKYNVVQMAPVFLAKKLHDLAATMSQSDTTETNTKELDAIKKFAAGFIKEHVVQVVNASIANMYRQSDINGNYDSLVARVVALHDTARVQEVAVEFAPNSITDHLRVSKMNTDIHNLEAELAWDMNPSTGGTIKRDNLSPNEVVAQEIKWASAAIEKTSAATDKAHNPSNEATVTVSPS